MASYMTDVGNVIDKSNNYPELKNSTSRKRDTSSLDMTDFLTLMVVQLQNQTIDSNMDTSDMLNQMVQMQMITALTNMTDASVMSYASSLVGKEVTIGVWNNGQLEEKVVKVTGTGLSNGTQVLFAGNEIYDLSSVMAVGRLPGGEDSGDETDKVEDSDKVEGGDKTEPGDNTDTGDKVEGGDNTNTNPGDKVDGGENNTNPGDKVDGGNETESSGGTEAAGESSATEQSGTSSRQMTDAEVEQLKDFLRNNGVDVTEQTTNDELVEMINGILQSGQSSTATTEDDATAENLAQTLEGILNGTRVPLPENYTETDLIKALEQLLQAQQVLNNTQQQTGAQARAKRVEEVQLEEFI